MENTESSPAGPLNSVFQFLLKFTQPFIFVSV